MKCRSTSINNTLRLKKNFAIDIELIQKIQKIANDRKELEILERTIDYWLAKDVFPDSDLTLDQALKFIVERANYTMAFYKQKSKKVK